MDKRNTPVDPITVNPGDFMVTSDTARLVSKANRLQFLKLQIHYEFKQARIGLGYAKDFIFIRQFEPISYSKQLRLLMPAWFDWHQQMVFNGWLQFYRIDKFLFTGDVQFGLNKFGKKFNRRFVKASPFFNFGVTVGAKCQNTFARLLLALSSKVTAAP